MGIILIFKQVSPYLLEKLKEYPDFVELFLDAASAMVEEVMNHQAVKDTKR